jgi:hypothetical protein
MIEINVKEVFLMVMLSPDLKIGDVENITWSVMLINSKAISEIKNKNNNK